jgi:DNA gyrase subunit A
VFDEESNLVFATKKGTIKKTKLSAYSHIRQSGIIAIKLDEGDELVETALTDGTREIVLATRKGLAARFDEKDARPIGRGTYGVRGIRLEQGDDVVSMAIVGPKDQLLSVTETGFGKRSLVDDYRKIKRGGKGVITIKTGGRNGDVISVMKVSDEDELIVTSVNGMVIRMPVQGISLQGRATMGVRVMRLKETDKIAAIARLVVGSEEERVVEAGRTLTTSPAPNGNGGDEAESPEEDSEKDEPDDE